MADDIIRLRSIAFYGSHGVTEAERAVGRPFEVDIELTCDLSTAGETDDLGTTVDYAAVCNCVERVNAGGPYMLLEAFAAKVANEVLASFPVRQVTVRARKPHPPVGLLVESAEVEITRSR